jgi:apolipoprotein N-acyltransferase
VARLICGLLASYPMYGFAVAILFSVPTQLAYHEPQAPSDWQAVSTHFGGVGLETPNPLAEYAAAQSIQETALSSPAHVIVFPETVVSNWNEATDAFWGPALEALKRKGKTILVGANVSDTHSPHYFNVIVIRGAEKQVDFLQRIPIPLAMWKPGSGRGVPLHLAGPATLELAGQRAAVLMCYEQLLIWPAVTSFKESPTILIGLANEYWTQSTTVSEIQRACLTSWAGLQAFISTDRMESDCSAMTVSNYNVFVGRMFFQRPQQFLREVSYASFTCPSRVRTSPINCLDTGNVQFLL